MSAPKHLTPIKAVAAYELVANQIQRAVQMGLLLPGDKLPPERALAEQLGVARMTVREAIRVLAHEGRITVKRGVRGGTWIRAQDLTRHELARLAADADRSIADVYEFREIIERAAARLAAKRAKAADVRRLKAVTREMESILQVHLKHPLPSHVPKFLALDSRFHTEIARISGNQFIIEATERALASRYKVIGAVFTALTADANDGHDKIIDAIARGDGAAAERIMRDHVSRSRTQLIARLNRHVRQQTG